MTPLAQPVPADAAPAIAPRALRICHIMSADLWAGAEIQLATTAAYLIERPDVHLSAVLLNEGRLASELRRLGVHVAVVDETRTTAVGIVRFLRRFLEAHQIELVHTHRYKDSILGSIAAKLAGVPCVVRTVHGLREPMTGWSSFKFRVYELLDKIALGCFADVVIAVSKRMAESLRDSGYRPTMVTHIHNGVNLDTTAARRTGREVRRELGLDERAFVIGTAGRLSPVKGHAGLLRAASLILQQEPRAVFLIAGDGPLERELRASASKLGVDRACRFLGARTDVHDVVSAMDLFVLPSLDEGIPMALLEAMALGKPVVASSVGGVPEVVGHGVTGLLVEPGNDQALADACLELTRNREYAHALGVQARRLVVEKFSHERSGDALIQVYRSIAGPPDARPRAEIHAHPVGRDGAALRVVPPAPISARRYGNTTDRSKIGAFALFRHLVTTFLAHILGILRVVVERRRAARLRRNPAAVQAALRSATSVLFVCRGNIVRSPFAAQVLRSGLPASTCVSIKSAGMQAVPGKAPHPTALRTASARQIDLSGHRAVSVGSDQIAASEVIFVMDVRQLVALGDRFPDARPKIFLLTSLAPELPLEIDDPVKGDEAVFQVCFDHIFRSVRPIVRTISAGARR